jgi:hypothetical protein
VNEHITGARDRLFRKWEHDREHRLTPEQVSAIDSAVDRARARGARWRAYVADRKRQIAAEQEGPKSGERSAE